MRCPKCGSEVDEGLPYCTQCGQRLTLAGKSPDPANKPADHAAPASRTVIAQDNSGQTRVDNSGQTNITFSGHTTFNQSDKAPMSAEEPRHGTVITITLVVVLALVALVAIVALSRPNSPIPPSIDVPAEPTATLTSTEIGAQVEPETPVGIGVVPSSEPAPNDATTPMEPPTSAPAIALATPSATPVELALATTGEITQTEQATEVEAAGAANASSPTDATDVPVPLTPTPTPTPQPTNPPVPPTPTPTLKSEPPTPATIPTAGPPIFVTRIFSATGYGYGSDIAKNPAQREQTALRAAEIVAKRNLAEIVYGAVISNETIILDGIVITDITISKVTAFVTRAVVVAQSYDPLTDQAIVTVQMSIDVLKP